MHSAPKSCTCCAVLPPDQCHDWVGLSTGAATRQLGVKRRRGHGPSHWTRCAPGPQTGALTRLRYAPSFVFQVLTIRAENRRCVLVPIWYIGASQRFSPRSRYLYRVTAQHESSVVLWRRPLVGRRLQALLNRARRRRTEFPQNSRQHTKGPVAATCAPSQR
jgi:hypothetical protein